MTGMEISEPNTVVLRLRFSTSRRKRGRSFKPSKAEVLRRVVDSSIAPASMNSQLLWGRVSLARAS